MEVARHNGRNANSASTTTNKTPVIRPNLIVGDMPATLIVQTPMMIRDRYELGEPDRDAERMDRPSRGLEPFGLDQLARNQPEGGQRRGVGDPVAESSQRRDQIEPAPPRFAGEHGQASGAIRQHRRRLDEDVGLERRHDRRDCPQRECAERTERPIE